jgi:hypothetical protein
MYNRQLTETTMVNTWVSLGRQKSLFFFFFFLYVHIRGGGGIRTSNLRFIKRSPQPIELPLGDLRQKPLGPNFIKAFWSVDYFKHPFNRCLVLDR